MAPPFGPDDAFLLIGQHHIMIRDELGVDVVKRGHRERLADNIHAELVQARKLHEETHGPQVVSLVIFLRFRSNQNVLQIEET